MGKQKYRIAHIVTTLELGGAQKHTLYVASRLDPARYETFLISGAEGLLQAEARRALGERWMIAPALQRAPGLIADIKAFGQVWMALRRVKPAIVHTHSSKAGILGRWAARAAGVRVIIHTVHGWSFTPCMPVLIKKGIILLERVTAAITTTFVAVAQYDIDTGCRYRIGPRKHYRLVRCGVEAGGDVSAQKNAVAHAPGAADVLAIACLKPQKNPRDIVRAAAIVNRTQPHVRWAIAGDGELRPRVETLIRENRLEQSVILLGWRRDIPQLLSAVRVVVLTSLWEGLPLAILEAMAAGRPVVAYNVSGVREAIEHGVTGYLVRPGDVHEFSRRVAELLADPSRAQSMGRAGQVRVRRQGYTCAAMMAALEAVYAQSALSHARVVSEKE